MSNLILIGVTLSGVWCVLPYAEVVVLTPPAPVRVGEAVHFEELLFRHGCHTPKVTFISQPKRVNISTLRHRR